MALQVDHIPKKSALPPEPAGKNFSRTTTRPPRFCEQISCSANNSAALQSCPDNDETASPGTCSSYTRTAVFTVSCCCDVALLILRVAVLTDRRRANEVEWSVVVARPGGRERELPAVMKEKSGDISTGAGWGGWASIVSGRRGMGAAGAKLGDSGRHIR